MKWPISSTTIYFEVNKCHSGAVLQEEGLVMFPSVVTSGDPNLHTQVYFKSKPDIFSSSLATS